MNKKYLMSQSDDEISESLPQKPAQTDYKPTTKRQKTSSDFHDSNSKVSQLLTQVENYRKESARPQIYQLHEKRTSVQLPNLTERVVVNKYQSSLQNADWYLSKPQARLSEECGEAEAENELKQLLMRLNYLDQQLRIPRKV